ncbi:chromosomal replication initiator protein DnaA [Candidatus Daviesbacteria bacterium]|nr:chromosomal replication initiator protein DnaA [Candidatus Daviesbacteria bacterium]
MDNLRLWHKFLETIKPSIGPANFKTFFSKTLLKSINEDKIIISTPHAFAKETLNQKHLPLIEQTFANLLGRDIQVEFVVKEMEIQPENEEEEFFQPIQTTTAVINPKYTLENFVVGPSNNVAFAAAQAVVQNPGTSYNPLFLYGGTGVGKTHLMLGIGNALLVKKPHLKIIYCSSEKFMNDYVTAIQEHKMGDLRRRYRSCDILLIDDIQFFSGREGTQEEFFHTFNELQTKSSQMILTSDRPPQEIAKLEDRLKSRFAGGLMIDIQPPDFDTRVAILRAKCIEQGSMLPEDSLKLIASSLDSNIRELEGKLIQILQALKAQGLSADPGNVGRFLGQSFRKPVITDSKQVLSTVCSFFNIALKDLTGPRRQKELVLPRHIAMYILSEELKLTVEKIGQALGGRDHTTVMHGRDKMKKLITTDREVQRILIEVKQKLIS